MSVHERLLEEGPRIAPESSSGAPVDRARFSSNVRRWLAPFLPAVITFGPLILVYQFLGASWWAAVAVSVWLFVIRRFGVPLVHRWKTGA
jgi:hypothetical protein